MEREYYQADISGTLTATDGTVIDVTVKHVDIDPKVAEAIFAMGIETGSRGWKHKTWRVPESALALVQAAARFYYGWSDTNEGIIRSPDGTVFFDAFYTC